MTIIEKITIAAIPVIIAAIVFVPMFSIWAVNTLFHTAIPVTWETWGASLWLTALLAARNVKSQ